MKVREFVSMLQKVDQDADLDFSVGKNSDYRKTCAALCLSVSEKDGDGVLEFLEPCEIKSVMYCDEGSEVRVLLKQDFYNDTYFDEKLCEYIESKNNGL